MEKEKIKEVDAKEAAELVKRITSQILKTPVRANGIYEKTRHTKQTRFSKSTEGGKAFSIRPLINEVIETKNEEGVVIRTSTRKALDKILPAKGFILSAGNRRNRRSALYPAKEGNNKALTKGRRKRNFGGIVARRRAER